jgi:TonB family protein
MSHTRGKCGNPKGCTTTDSRRSVNMPAGKGFVRRESGEKLRPFGARLRTLLSTPFVLFLALQAAFFGCIAWTRISHPGLQKAFAVSADAGVPALRLADSNTIGSGLGPALAQESLTHLGTAHVQLRNRVNVKERRVSSTLPESTSQTVIAISPHGSAAAFSGLAPTNHDIGTALDPVGQTTAEEIQPPAVSEVLGAPAGYGRVPAWVVDTPVQMPGEPPRVSSGVTGGLIVHQVTPVYPAQARTRGIQGAVVLEAIIGEDGTVPHVTVLSGPSSLATAAQRAVQQWRYTPFELNGKPVATRKQITIKFTLH